MLISEDGPESVGRSRPDRVHRSSQDTDRSAAYTPPGVRRRPARRPIVDERRTLIHDDAASGDRVGAGVGLQMMEGAW